MSHLIQCSFARSLARPYTNPTPLPGFDPSIPIFNIPNNFPPPGPAIELPPIEAMPHPADEPIGDPDEAARKRLLPSLQR
jgi:hypothetical protein